MTDIRDGDIKTLRFIQKITNKVALAVIGLLGTGVLAVLSWSLAGASRAYQLERDFAAYVKEQDEWKKEASAKELAEVTRLEERLDRLFDTTKILTKDVARTEKTLNESNKYMADCLHMVDKLLPASKTKDMPIETIMPKPEVAVPEPPERKPQKQYPTAIEK